MADDNLDLRTISNTNAYIASLVKTPDVVNDYFWIGGIVTYVRKTHFHYTYFTLTDEEKSIECMLSNRYEDKSIFIVKGAMVDVYGVLDVHEKIAKFQIKVSDVRPAELNDSTIDQSVLEQLEAQGLFPRNKKDLPKNPKHISLITSKSSEALRDFKHVYTEQNGKAIIDTLDTLVQGEQAPKLITQRIREANHDAKTDIIVLTRGGGRHDDLAIFNDIQIATAICNSKIPIVTGIGHQRNETIADRVADQKTISPTDAGYKLALLSSQETEINVQQKPKVPTKQSENSTILQAIVIATFIILVVIIWFLMGSL